MDAIDFTNLNEATGTLKVLSNPNRLKILCVLIGGEMPVQRIEMLTQIHQPTLSQQLTVLREAEIVSTRREGKMIHYRLIDSNIQAILETLHQLYCK